MKLMIASDIHGSKFYCEKLMIRLMEENPDKLILLGDILYHGPRNDLPKDYDPKAVISLLNVVADQIICVRGNCDAEVDQMVLNFPITSETICIYDGIFTMYMTHGHKYNMSNPLPMPEKSVLIYGHTHVPMAEYKDGILFLNPGSVSMPKEESEHSYLIYEDGKFLWKGLEGAEISKIKL